MHHAARLGDIVRMPVPRRQLLYELAQRVYLVDDVAAQHGTEGGLVDVLGGRPATLAVLRRAHARAGRGRQRHLPHPSRDRRQADRMGRHPQAAQPPAAGQGDDEAGIQVRKEGKRQANRLSGDRENLYLHRGRA